MLTLAAAIVSATSLIISALTARRSKRLPDPERIELIERAVVGLVQAHKARKTRRRK